MQHTHSLYSRMMMDNNALPCKQVMAYPGRVFTHRPSDLLDSVRAKVLKAIKKKSSLWSTCHQGVEFYIGCQNKQKQVTTLTSISSDVVWDRLAGLSAIPGRLEEILLKEKGKQGDILPHLKKKKKVTIKTCNPFCGLLQSVLIKMGQFVLWKFVP